MSGLFGTVILGRAGDSTVAAACDRHSEVALTLNSLAEHYNTRECLVKRGVRVGVVQPKQSRWVVRIHERSDGLSTLVYLGDGRVRNIDLDGCVERDDVSRLSGAFAAVVVEYQSTASGRVVSRCQLIRDRSGSIPLLWRLVDEVLHFAPRMVALRFLENAPLEEELDVGSAAQFLSSGWIQGGGTLHRAVRWATPAGCDIFRPEQPMRTRRYWHYPPVADSPRMSEAALRDLALSRLQESMQLNFSEPQVSALFLSGGIDSRTLLGVAIRNGVDPSAIQTLSWGERDDVEGNDGAIARALAEAAGTRHRFIPKVCKDYGSDFAQSCRLSDWSVEEAWMQPVEWKVMRQLAAEGIAIGIRGDQLLPDVRAAGSVGDAQMMAEIYRFSQQPIWQQLFHADAWSGFAEQGDAILESMIVDPHSFDPTELSDLYRYEQEVSIQHVGVANYKTAFIDQRNPILDDSFLRILPDTTRADRHRRALFVRMYEVVNQPWQHIPLATRHSDGNSADFFHVGGLGRAQLEAALADRNSAVHDLIDPERLRELMPATTAQQLPPAKYSLKKRVKQNVVQNLMPLAPKRLSEMSYQSRHANLPLANVFGRYLILKNFVDSRTRQPARAL